MLGKGALGTLEYERGGHNDRYGAGTVTRLSISR